jgi:anti-anti-sigma regulatory factor
MTFKARTERQAGATIVTFTGELDIASEAAVLKAALDGAGMLVDYPRALDFIDSTGVRVLLSADLLAREPGCASAWRAATGWSAACSRSPASTSDCPSSTTPLS